MTAQELVAQAPGTIRLFVSFGLGGIFCLAVVEKFVPVFPSYILLMLIGLMAPDPLTLVFSIAAMTAGSVTGGLGWYTVGWMFGPQRVRRTVANYGGYILLRLSFYDGLTDSYRRNHFWVTLSGQIIPAVRIYMALPAGALRLDPKTFLAATSLGCLIWNGSFLCLGYGLRYSGRDVVQTGFWVLLTIIAAEGALLIAVRLRKRVTKG
ncbi:DedA family protein [Rhizobium sp. P44RR-XXIV]|uniref:DedA family protein n=1 Tax=Rhizobium sp. P44RR-XXIV TaxID=1921145 RepID=UPI0009845469|nr:DedA family protein [Rhizobium sp. P44RR-XXIV]TIX87255.1 DedA family protein [Rhizobium sp. P44RR-XXIV]